MKTKGYIAHTAQQGAGYTAPAVACAMSVNAANITVAITTAFVFPTYLFDNYKLVKYEFRNYREKRKGRDPIQKN